MPSFPPALPEQARPPRFQLSSEPPSRIDQPVQAVAVLVADGELTLGPGSAEMSEDLGLDILELLSLLGATGAAGEVTALPVAGRDAVVVGVGSGSPVELRRAGAALGRRAKGASGLASSVSAVADDTGLTAFVAGLVLGSFTFTMRTTDPPAGPVGSVVLSCCSADATVVQRAEAIATASWTARFLATVPANIENPQWLVERGVEYAEHAGVRTRVWDERQLAADGFGGILGVGQGSASPPRLLRLDYIPAKASRKTPQVVIVGKGITFDSGGLSIKPGQAMVNMKRDMTGAAVVIAVLSALGAVGCPVRVTGLVATAENAVGANSMRPGDVLTHFGGRTTEVTNTDAEGRLVMADALAYGAAKVKPDVLVDIATLTGAVKVALGLHQGGYFTTHQELADTIAEASRASGERLWRLPLSEEYEYLLASTVADAENAPGKVGAVTAALFLQHFTAGLPWLHLDVASVGDSAEEDFEWTAGPTGFGARLLLHWLGSAEPLKGLH